MIARLSLVVKRVFHLVSTRVLESNLYGSSLKTNFKALTQQKSLASNTHDTHPGGESEVSIPESLSHSDYQHPATAKYEQKNGPFVVMGLQNHDFIKEYLAFIRLGERDPSIEHLNGIEVYVYSNDKPITKADSSTDNQALIDTGASFKWYKNANEAIADFKSRIEFFGGSISQVTVHSSFPELKVKIEDVLRNYESELKIVIQDFIIDKKV